MDINTKETLEKIFPPFSLGENRSLLECDFYDTHYRYFDQIDDDYLSAVEMTAEDLLLKWGFDWPEFYLQVGLEAARSRTRPLEGITTWKDISYQYLYYFGYNCSFLSSEGYKLFFPAAVYHFLTTDQNKAYIDWFIFRLNSQWEKDNHVFNDIQKEFIFEFVKEHYKGYVSWIPNN
ncbi:hypothetical protein DJ533_04445 [Acinetobacter defluvii]|uniref:Uncharacterized protein n=1 Tax=Acinetobacter defluvii TaxID=1871111 RepID=A0A2S2FAA9_9GAMM|nr:hypothetical protein [Acinetobacter defluvii]AWL27887.1 hypothetical protein DJ533_04445 [Acinetobacter defluvii]